MPTPGHYRHQQIGAAGCSFPSRLGHPPHKSPFSSDVLSGDAETLGPMKEYVEWGWIGSEQVLCFLSHNPKKNSRCAYDFKCLRTVVPWSKEPLPWTSGRLKEQKINVKRKWISN